MAFKKVQTGFSSALKIGSGKKGTVKQATGFLVGLKTGVGKFKSNILKLIPQKGGQKFEVWSNGALDFALLDDNGKKFKPEFNNKLVRFTFAGVIPAKKNQSAGVKVEIEVDDSAKLPAGAGRIKF